MSNIGKPINPYALGAYFLEHCVRQGWLMREGDGKSAKWYLTEVGERELPVFGVEINKILMRANSV